jgi:microcin C transport system substrate-binding protein
VSLNVRRSGQTRRGALLAGGAGLALAFAPPFAWAAGRTGLHGLSVFGDLKYDADFTHFDYIDPNAPKGGRMNFSPPNWGFNQSTQTFNTLNSFVLKGDSPPRMEITFDALMTRAYDEADAVYGLVAERVDVSQDGNVYTFHTRSAARFHDGSPLRAHDIAFSMQLLKEKGHPSISQLMGEMVSATATDATTLVVTLTGNQNRETILTLVDLPIFSEKFYTENEFDAATLDPPLSSGPYRVGNFNAGRFIEYERVEDYWAAELPVARGHNNFDRIRIDFFAERQTAFEAFKKGEITYRQEFTSLTWAEGYNFPAMTEGKVRKSTDFASEAVPSMQGWFVNTRRAKFADPRTRQAIGLAFDFEWTNRNLFFDSYARQYSFFQRSPLGANGLPDGAELTLLEPFRDSLPPAVFEEPYVPPVTDGSGRDRAILRQAQDLLLEAGWTLQDGKLIGADGEQLTVEFLIRSAVFERVLSPFVENLRRLGINGRIRQVDPAQYTARLDAFDFDIVGAAFGLSATPLDSLQLFFSTRSAESAGGRNLAGVREPAIDALLDKVKDIESRADLEAITRALDRILRARHYWIPNWFAPSHRVAHWDVFGWPDIKPDYAFQPEHTWWFDADRAAAIGVSE